MFDINGYRANVGTCDYATEWEKSDGTECIAVCGKSSGHNGAHGEWRG